MKLIKPKGITYRAEEEEEEILSLGQQTVNKLPVKLQYENFANTQYIGKIFPVVSHTIIYLESVL